MQNNTWIFHYNQIVGKLEHDTIKTLTLLVPPRSHLKIFFSQHLVTINSSNISHHEVKSSALFEFEVILAEEWDYEAQKRVSCRRHQISKNDFRFND